MAGITIRNLEDTVKAACASGRCITAAPWKKRRGTVREAVRDQPAPTNLADRAEALFGPDGGELEPHPPIEVREPPPIGFVPVVKIEP